MSSNLLKGSWVQLQSDDARVIDNNERLEKLLRKRSAPVRTESEDGAPAAEGEAPEGFQGGLDAQELQGLLADTDDPAAVIKAEKPVPQAPVYEGPDPEELIAQAQEEIRQMKKAAEEEIQAEKQKAAEAGMQEGRTQGYNDGAAAAEAEIAEAKSQLEAEYQERMKELEPECVRQLTAIYEHIFHVELGQYQNLVLQLLDGCMQKIENSSSYILHVSPDDYPFVSMQKKSLMEVMGNKNASLEVVEDMMMKRNECMIEADGGIYDCSLDVQLQALRMELMALAYEGVK